MDAEDGEISDEHMVAREDDHVGAREDGHVATREATSESLPSDQNAAAIIEESMEPTQTAPPPTETPVSCRHTPVS